ncbi:hypothetical protein GCM10009867_07300 [Pedococcus aerophilus]|uniref:Uncharacterized protein n=1 Tax=Pedococcus aerophilus TaxID=436356 RepID=A0ABN3UK35_9MICO
MPTDDESHCVGVCDEMASSHAPAPHTRHEPIAAWSISDPGSVTRGADREDFEVAGGCLRYGTPAVFVYSVGDGGADPDDIHGDTTNCRSRSVRDIGSGVGEVVHFSAGRRLRRLGAELS